MECSGQERTGCDREIVLPAVSSKLVTTSTVLGCSSCWEIVEVEVMSVKER